MAKLSALFISLIRIVQGLAGAYAALKLSLYGIAYMRKNQQKVEEAKEGIMNVFIGLAIVILCEVITGIVKGAIG
ncbi:hypothetical protein CRD70_14045 [Listeria monocytogenes]|uniref:Uncharacterized protein n=1 Tax=Listeria monocytogenes TaxID=1639 RepID=A0A823J083_LISMN|nr:hypothetical protein [Listeria monocytogenes]EAE5923278.1 hypothetical protein [Listeria monocytogenes]EAG6688905.1 hypothetical protein [Listeria monocytogenes]EAG9355041.1 hypothetical protein [Listeria monocytogenes]EHY61360.1 hypothetical protein LMIV_p025 [Listeria monocytogenes FSL J1-208]QOF63840.1 hypothetical protein IFI77_14050 [Listeria monocytogenes FSL J1-208]